MEDFRPDAIICKGQVYYGKYMSYSQVSYYSSNSGPSDHHVAFHANHEGTYYTWSGTNANIYGCMKSIKQLYDDCQAFNLVSSVPKELTKRYSTSTYVAEWP